jgi:ribosomal protein S27E
MRLLRVKCPKCGWVQSTRSRTSVQCFKCGYRYAIFPRGKKSRVVGSIDTDRENRRRMWGSHLAWRYVMGRGA